MFCKYITCGDVEHAVRNEGQLCSDRVMVMAGRYNKAHRYLFGIALSSTLGGMITDCGALNQLYLQPVEADSRALRRRG